jgi:addiction module RelE/StbE family toxin
MPRILYSKNFIGQFEKLSESIRNTAFKKIEIFKKNNNHPSLKTHKLHGELAGYFSFSVNYDLRIVFSYEGNKEIHFHKIGSHDIYK